MVSYLLSIKSLCLANVPGKDSPFHIEWFFSNPKELPSPRQGIKLRAFTPFAPAVSGEAVCYPDYAGSR
jgi:hypothetical protein